MQGMQPRICNKGMNNMFNKLCYKQYRMYKCSKSVMIVVGHTMLHR